MLTLPAENIFGESLYCMIPTRIFAAHLGLSCTHPLKTCQKGLQEDHWASSVPSGMVYHLA